jgi:hypothetical protein
MSAKATIASLWPVPAMDLIKKPQVSSFGTPRLGKSTR